MDCSRWPAVDVTAQQDPQQVEALIAAYAPLVKYLAHRLACRLPASIGVDDLISAGVLGLLDAIENYDPKRQNLFKTYAEGRMRGAMLDYVRAGDWGPRSVREQEHALTQAYAAIERQQGRPATDAEVAAWLGLDLDTFAHWLSDVRGVSVVSLDKPLAQEAEGSPVTALAPLAQEAPGPSECAEREELKAHLAAAIDALPQQDKVVLSLYDCEELTLREIGAVLGVPEARIAQIRTTAILHLRATLQNLTQDADAPAA
jgi:RNA polymerase sigma factor for flagellar operon FliA